MKAKQTKSGFSLTEVLMAVGILSIGFMLVATMFPLGMHLTAVAAERTIAAIVADQAFAKIRLYGVVDFNDPNWTAPANLNFTDFEFVSSNRIDPNEFAYPSTDPHRNTSQYYWAAICRKINNNPSNKNIQVIVFVSRKRGAGLKFQGFDQPVPVEVDVSPATYPDSLKNNDDERLLIPGCTIVDNATGQIYRVIERSVTDSFIVTLDRDWDDRTLEPDNIWVIAPPDTGGKDPVIAVFQKIIKF